MKKHEYPIETKFYTVKLVCTTGAFMFVPEHKLRVLVRTALPRCTNDTCFEQKSDNNQNFMRGSRGGDRGSGPPPPGI